MSIVIVGLTSKSAVIMSDGKLTTSNTSIDTEHFRKIAKINPYVCIGTTGSIDFYNTMFPIFNSIPKNIQQIKIEDTFQMLYSASKFVMENNPSLGESCIVVCGVNKNNEIESIGFSTKDFVINHQQTQGDDVAFQVLNNYPNVFEITKNNIIECKNLIVGMEKTIRYISTVDDSVNDTIFVEEITL